MNSICDTDAYWKFEVNPAVAYPKSVNDKIDIAENAAVYYDVGMAAIAKPQTILVE